MQKTFSKLEYAGKKKLTRRDRILADLEQLLHGQESHVVGDAGYTGAAKRPKHAARDVIWSIAARPSSYQQYGKDSVLYQAKRKIEYAKAQLRAKVEPPF